MHWWSSCNFFFTLLILSGLSLPAQSNVNRQLTASVNRLCIHSILWIAHFIWQFQADGKLLGACQ